MVDIKLYVPGVTLSIQDNAKLLKQVETRFKRTINGNKYQSNVLTQRKTCIWINLIDPTFQIVKRHFVLTFKDYGV